MFVVNVDFTAVLRDRVWRYEGRCRAASGQADTMLLAFGLKIERFDVCRVPKEEKRWRKRLHIAHIAFRPGPSSISCSSVVTHTLF